MDVRLPNGTVVKNVPDGMSQADLLARLGSAGIDHAASQGAAPGVPNAFTDANTPKPQTPAQPPQNSFSQGVVNSFKAIPDEMGKAGAQAASNIQGDLSRPMKPGVLPKVLRAGKTAADVADYVTSPITGALAATVGRPVEKVTGIPARQVAENIELATPIGYGAGKSRALKDGAKAVERVFSPTTVDATAKQTERTIRRATGQGSLEAEKSAAQLIKHSPLVGNLPVPQQRGLIDYIENRSTRGRLSDPKLQASADAIANVYDRYKKRIQYIIGQNGPSFIQDYYSHLWKDPPGKVASNLDAFYAKQGTGRSLKERTIPTISDGIKAGLTPETENPIEATMTYAQNMSRFLATHDIQNELKGLGYAKYYAPGSAPKGWVELNGINTKRNPVIQGANGPQAHPMTLHAPEGAARVYNNFISKGLERGDAAPFYQAARNTANGLTQLKLGLSAFHGMTMASEGVISDVARSFQAASRGDAETALKAFAKAPTAPVTTAMRGGRMKSELLGKTVPDAMSRKVNDAYVNSGGRVRMDPFYRTNNGAGSFYNAIEKGTFKRELGEAAGKIFGPGTPAGERAKATVGLVGNAIQTVAAPLFEKYVPAMKRGAFASRMEDFIRANPKATQDELDRYALKLNDSVDNRFGELVQDNLFWNKQMKQISQLALLSPTWDLGTVREIVGGLADVAPGAKDVLAGKGISDRTAYVAALAATTAMINGAMTYMRTGDKPEGRDFMAYRTGGKDIVSGQPERAITPGYQKDVYAFGYNFPHNVLQESENKLNPALTAAVGLAQNKDYRGMPIYRPQGAAPQPGEPGLMDFALDTLMPISVGQFSKGEKKGSKLSTVERAASIRPAPGYITAPERQEALRNKYDTRAWRARLKADAREKARLQQ